MMTFQSWATRRVFYLAQKGVITGYDNGNFGAHDPITRVQSALMLDRAIVYSDDVAPNPAYADVTETTYGYDVIAKMTEQGVFTGEHHYFYPEQIID